MRKGEHLDAAKRHPLYREPQAPVCAQLPFELAHVRQFFVQMSRKRQNGMAANPLSSLDILAWQLRHRIRLTVWKRNWSISSTQRISPIKTVLIRLASTRPIYSRGDTKNTTVIARAASDLHCHPSVVFFMGKL